MRALALALLLAWPAVAQPVSVLTYHRFDKHFAGAATVVETQVFIAQMEWLRAHDVAVVRLSTIVAAVSGGAPVAEKSVAITADDGWHSVYTEMFPVIRRLGYPITLFINPPTIGQGGAYLTWAQIDDMRASGLVELQAHTQTHPNFNAERIRRTPADYAAFIDRELGGGRDTLRDHVGAVPYLAWPYGIHDRVLQAAAARVGFTAAFALGSRPVLATSPVFAIPRYQVYNTDTGARFAAIVAGLPRRTGDQ
ncbi:MAG: polysaccharide deacetylase family protein [Acetobacteraceae bacterium]|nr:polysaccharide deacetylase family protein [Acetobacteraceae bacterium]